MLDVAIHNANCMLSDLYAAFNSDENPDDAFVDRIIQVESDVKVLKKYKTNNTPKFRTSTQLVNKYADHQHYCR